MNYNKVIKDLKERNDKLQEQYRLRDIRCIHLEYENEMLKSDFKAQHELTKKYAEESKELNKKYLNAVADYETTMSELQELKLELSGYRQAILKDKEMLGLKEENDKLKKQIAILDKTNIQLISKLDRYDAIVDERDELKKQLDYLRSGEYYNQLRFERDMLQNVVDNGEVSKEDKEFIDMTHRNTELLEENQKYKEVIDKVRKLIEKHYYKESDDYYDYFTEGVCLQDGDYNELEDILNEVSE